MEPAKDVFLARPDSCSREFRQYAGPYDYKPPIMLRCKAITFMSCLYDRHAGLSGNVFASHS